MGFLQATSPGHS